MARVAWAGALWLLIAVLAGITGVTTRLEPPAPQLLLLSLTAVLLAVGRLSDPFRRWLLAVDWRVIVALHLSRFVGAAFLAMYADGELPYAFAVPAGVGDILVAASAAALLITPAFVAGRPRVLLAWNIVGFADILFVVLTAARLALEAPASMAALMRFPMSLVPTFLVPLIIGSHILLFIRLHRAPVAA